MNQFDLTVFNDEHDDECDASNYKKCVSMKRLTHGLKYYSVLNILQNENDGEIFRNFVMEIYCGFNDDFIHFMQYHQNELEQILKDLINNNLFDECSINECIYTARHHRTDRSKRKIINDNVVFDAKMNLYCDLMDDLHFIIFHSFDTGLRTLKVIEDDGDDNHHEEKNDDYFDAVFARIHSKIRKSEINTKSFDRFSIKNTKFNILTQNKVTQNKNGDDHVYCDEMFKYLFKSNVNINEIKELYHLIKDQEFDTDSVKDDESLEPNGNITKTIKNQRLKYIYNKFIKNTKLSSQSFAIGFRFYYWIYYKDIKQLEHGDGDNINDHSCFEVNELHIEAKYSSLKDEISNYRHITMKQYTEEVIVKVKEYKKSARFKKMTATSRGARHHHYDIKKGEQLRVEHLLSLTLYTDYTDHCSAFSATFRRKNIFETLKSVMERNRQYYFMSKYLRECVEVFGQCHFDERRWKNDYIRGRFYSGVNAAMIMISFNLRLCSPTSTSTQIEVAMKFSGSDGMVLQLNNPPSNQYYSLHGFNASFISKYKEEDERLFFGGYFFIKIESIRIRTTKQNFEKFIYSICYLDTMLTGGELLPLKITEDDVFIVNHLMNVVSNKSEDTTAPFDDYLYRTFDAFASNKRQIVFDLDSLNDVKDSRIIDLLMNDLEKREHKKEKERECDDMTNLFKSKLFEIFKNIQNIVINTTTYFENESFSLSMMCLLRVIIESNSVKHIMVKASNDIESDYNWIKALWESSSKQLTESYKHQNYTVSIQENGNQNWFVIHKK